MKILICKKREKHLGDPPYEVLIGAEASCFRAISKLAWKVLSRKVNYNKNYFKRKIVEMIENEKDHWVVCPVRKIELFIVK